MSRARYSFGAALGLAATAATTVIAVAAAGLLATAGCKVKDPPPITAETGEWRDDFERKRIGGDYYKTGGGYEIEDGVLTTRNSHNHPLWLRKKLPRDVEIEFVVWSDSPEGDIKVEVFGDGRSHARDKGAYRATGYVLVHGGWGNSKSILARGDEHGSQLVERRQPPVVPGRKYRWRIRRQDNRIDWWIAVVNLPQLEDTTPFLSYIDANPFEGPGHEYFGFNNWETELSFDELVIRPL